MKRILVTGFLTSLLCIWGVGIGSAETPEQRCARERDAYNKSMEVLWRANNPGKEPSSDSWPEYVCVKAPDVGNNNAGTKPEGAGGKSDSGATSGGNTENAGAQGAAEGVQEVPNGNSAAAPENSQGEAQSPISQGETGTGDVAAVDHQRTHRWDGSAGSGTTQRSHRWGNEGNASEYQQDMRLGSLGNTQGVEGSSSESASSNQGGQSAADSASSNVGKIPVWEQEVVRDDGTSSTVRVAENNSGQRVVVDESGRGTGEIVVSDPDKGVDQLKPSDELRGTQILPESQNMDSSTNPQQGARTGGEKSTGSSNQESAVNNNNTAPAESVSQETHPAEEEQNSDSAEDRLLGILAAASGGVASLSRRRRKRDGSWQADIDWGAGRNQSLILLEGPESPREHRFAMNVPEGGSMVKNPDGSVDVLDADGNMVEHVRKPWAYDAAGRPVNTHFEVDSETGELVQVVDPGRSTRLPILADPDRVAAESSRPEQVGLVNTAGREDGETWTEDLGHGEVATHYILPDTGGQSVRTDVTRADGSYTTTYSVINDLGGSDVWSDNSNGQASYQQFDADGALESTHYEQSPVISNNVIAESETTPGGEESTYVTYNPDGSSSYGQAYRMNEDSVYAEVENPAGDQSHVFSTAHDDGRFSTAVQDAAYEERGVAKVDPGDGTGVVEVEPGDERLGDVLFPDGENNWDSEVIPESGIVQDQARAQEEPKDPQKPGDPDKPGDPEDPESIFDNPHVKRAGDVATALGGFGDGIEMEMEPTGRRGLQSTGLDGKGLITNENWEKFGKGLGGVAGGAASFLSKSEYAYKAFNDSDNAGLYVAEAIVDAGVGRGATAAGAAVGGLFGPFAPLTIPLGAAAGAYLGSKISGKINDSIEDKYKK